MSIDLPKVSVVTITYGHEKYITETLDGVLMQQYEGPVEFIIANDNSPDATDEVVKKYFLENPAPSNFEIKYTKHETNKGMMPNFIWALEQATGKYIALCEGDDYWTDPLKLQKQVDFLEENLNYSFCTHRFLLKREGFSDNVNIDASTQNAESSDYGEQFYNGNHIEIDYIMFYRAWLTQPLTTVFRNDNMKELISFSDKFTYFRDVHLFYFLLQKGMGYSFNSFMGVYRRHPGGEESGKGRKEKISLKMRIWKELFEHFPFDNNLRAQYIEAALRFMEVTDQNTRLKLYKDLLKVSTSMYFFMKVTHKFITIWFDKKVYNE